MDVSKDVLCGLVKATRLARKLACNLQMIVSDGSVTTADTIFGMLADCISKAMEETLSMTENFMTDSITMKLINSKLSDAEVAEYIIDRSKLPRPLTMDRDETMMLFEQNGGY